VVAIFAIFAARRARSLDVPVWVIVGRLCGRQ
jgi:hypothetical protein